MKINDILPTLKSIHNYANVLLLSATKYNQLKQSIYIEIVVNSFNEETASFELKTKFCKAYLAGPRINLLCIPIKFICRIAAETKM